MTMNKICAYRLAVSANDAKVRIENGVVRAVENPGPDTAGRLTSNATLPGTAD